MNVIIGMIVESVLLSVCSPLLQSSKAARAACQEGTDRLGDRLYRPTLRSAKMRARLKIEHGRVEKRVFNLMS